MKANAAHAVESGPFEGSIGAFSSTLPKISLSSALARFLDPPAGTMRAYVTRTVAICCIAGRLIHFDRVDFETFAALAALATDLAMRILELFWSAKELIMHEPWAAQFRTDLTPLRS